LRAFDDLIRQGKVRSIGASNYTAWRLATPLWTSDTHGYARYETLQPRYNLAARDEYERELEPLCQEQGIGVITYSSLASGFFSGKYRAGQPLPTTARTQSVQKGYMNEKGFAILDAVEHVAREQGAMPGQVALAWILARPAVTAPIASATTVEQTRELLGAADLHLSTEALATLDAASAWRP